MMTERALSWLDEEQAKQRLLRGADIPEDFDVVLYGIGPNYADKSTEEAITLKSLRQRGQHVRRS